MTVSTLRPNGTAQNLNVSRVGAASDHAALSDNSDSSYLTSWSDGGVAVELGDFTLPAGAVIKSFCPRIRCALASGSAGSIQVWLGDSPYPTGSQFYSYSQSVGWTSPTTVSGATVPTTGWTDPGVDELMLSLFGFGNPTSEQIRIYEAYLDITYVEKPEVTILEPTGTISDTNSPVVSWSMS